MTCNESKEEEEEASHLDDEVPAFPARQMGGRVAMDVGGVHAPAPFNIPRQT